MFWIFELERKDNWVCYSGIFCANIWYLTLPSLWYEAQPPMRRKSFLSPGATEPWSVADVARSVRQVHDCLIPDSLTSMCIKPWDVCCKLSVSLCMSLQTGKGVFLKCQACLAEAANMFWNFPREILR